MPPPRRSFESYVNAVFAIVSYGSLAIFSWTILPHVLNYTFTIIFVFLFLLQVFGLVTEVAGFDWEQNPWTGEWRKME